MKRKRGNVIVCNLAILSDIEIRDPQAYFVMSAESFIEDYLHCDEFVRCWESRKISCGHGLRAAEHKAGNTIRAFSKT